MNLDDVLFRTVGRAPRRAVFEIVRELSLEDIKLLEIEKGVKPSALQRITARHHMLARCVASGMGVTQAALVCNYTPSRVSVLIDDPAFSELLEYYSSEIEGKYVGMHEQLAGIARDAAWELQERLEAEPEKLSVGQLMELTKMGADRTGHGPSPTQQTNVQNNSYVVALPSTAESVDDWKNSRSTRLLEHKG